MLAVLGHWTRHADIPTLSTLTPHKPSRPANQLPRPTAPTTTMKSVFAAAALLALSAAPRASAVAPTVPPTTASPTTAPPTTAPPPYLLRLTSELIAVDGSLEPVTQTFETPFDTADLCPENFIGQVGGALAMGAMFNPDGSVASWDLTKWAGHAAVDGPAGWAADTAAFCLPTITEQAAQIVGAAASDAGTTPDEFVNDFGNMDWTTEPDVVKCKSDSNELEEFRTLVVGFAAAGTVDPYAGTIAGALVSEEAVFELFLDDPECAKDPDYSIEGVAMLTNSLAGATSAGSDSYLLEARIRGYSNDQKDMDICNNSGVASYRFRNAVTDTVTECYGL